MSGREWRRVEDIAQVVLTWVAVLPCVVCFKVKALRDIQTCSITAARQCTTLDGGLCANYLDAAKINWHTLFHLTVWPKRTIPWQEEANRLIKHPSRQAAKLQRQRQRQRQDCVLKTIKDVSVIRIMSPENLTPG